MSADELFVVWTTVSTKDQAAAMAEAIVKADLAACAQIDQEVTSVYKWKGQLEKETECRLWIKCLQKTLPALREWMKANHPYETFQWIELKADQVHEPYLNWAKSSK